MSLTRKMLKGLGIEEEKIDFIIDAHTETVEALKKSKTDIEAEIESYKDFKKKFEDLQKDVDAKNDWKTKYDELKAEFDGFKSDVDNEKVIAKKTDAYKKLLTECRIAEATHSACINASANDIEGIEFNENGEVTNADAVKDAINSRWNGFIVETQKIGANPAKGNNNNTMTKADIMAITDSAERQKAIAQNIELFNKGGN